jgi:hypothetical protein
MADLKKRIDLLERDAGIWTLEDQTIYIGMDDDADDATMKHYAINRSTGERKRISTKTYATMLRQEIENGAVRFKTTVE